MVTKYFKLFVVLSNLCLITAYNGKGYKKANISCFETISESKVQTLIECCSLCSATDSCQGVSFENGNCKTLKNVMVWGHNELEAWIDASLLQPTGKLYFIKQSV